MELIENSTIGELIGEAEGNGGSLQFELPGFDVSPCGLVPTSKATHEDWLRLGELIGQAHKRVMWVVGDWYLIGAERQWGEMYDDCERLFGISQKTARNAVTVAKAFELSRRRDNLSWSHHAAVAGVTEERQELLLGKAQAQSLSEKEVRALVKEHRETAEQEQQLVEEPAAPLAWEADAIEWLRRHRGCTVDLLLTDPPYSTDMPWSDFSHFVTRWLPEALSKLKPTGRAFVFIGPYPREVALYLEVAAAYGWSPAQLLVWTYKNTMGPKTKYKYFLNHQLVLYWVGNDAEPLETDVLLELNSVQEFAHPARTPNRVHEWQKPDQLAEQYIRHSTKPGDLVIDPFCCTGTFLLAATRLGRKAEGCDVSSENLELAQGRGVQLTSDHV